MSQATLEDEDYIIGANEAEVQRLGLQHALWREAALGAWRRAGLKEGMTVLDLGCGPGYAAFDLAQLVGPGGRVIAVDQSELFLQALEAGARARGLSNIEPRQAAIEDFAWPEGECDRVWSRWVLCFLPDPDTAIAGIDRALKPGGVFMTLEYIDYSSFRLEPAEPVFDRFVAAVEASWRHFEGDPNVGRRFPGMFNRHGWTIEEMTPEMHAVRPGEALWRWPASWLKEAPARLVELGFLSSEDAAGFLDFVARREGDPDALLMTPMVITARARKPKG